MSVLGQYPGLIDPVSRPLVYVFNIINFIRFSRTDVIIWVSHAIDYVANTSNPDTPTSPTHCPSASRSCHPKYRLRASLTHLAAVPAAATSTVAVAQPATERTCRTHPCSSCRRLCRHPFQQRRRVNMLHHPRRTMCLPSGQHPTQQRQRRQRQQRHHCHRLLLVEPASDAANQHNDPAPAVSPRHSSPAIRRTGASRCCPVRLTAPSSPAHRHQHRQFAPHPHRNHQHQHHRHSIRTPTATARTPTLMRRPHAITSVM